jgi:hypothetical protein
MPKQRGPRNSTKRKKRPGRNCVEKSKIPQAKGLKTNFLKLVRRLSCRNKGDRNKIRLIAFIVAQLLRLLIDIG